MDFTPSQRSGGLLLLAGLAAFAVLLLGGSSSAVSGDPPSSAEPAEPNVVLSGSYACTISETTFIQPPPPEPLIFREMVDSITMSATGGVLASPPAPPRMPMSAFPGGREPSPPITTDIGTGHGFNDGTIEDCIRFAESVAAVARRLNCVTSEVRHRPPFFQTEIANLSFVCEGSASAQVHAIGELDRAVLALKPLPAH